MKRRLWIPAHAGLHAGNPIERSRVVLGSQRVRVLPHLVREVYQGDDDDNGAEEFAQVRERFETQARSPTAGSCEAQPSFVNTSGARYRPANPAAA